ncbi:MAG: DUF6242 domain-containing protein [Prevotella sp.]|nr:DUF6242 domain-containing protein [Prevotella sp.]
MIEGMRRFFLRCCVLLACVSTVTSCLKDDEEDYSGFTDVAITQFTLGTLNRYTHTVSSKTGNDTIMKSTLAGSSYRMTIDHLNRRIYNATPLPVGTDAAHVLCTVSAKNGGLVALKSVIGDTLRWHAATDSVDLSVPRVFRVMARDGINTRDYTVTLNVSSSQGVSFEWQMVKADEALAWNEGMRLEVDGDSVRLCAKDKIVGRSTTACYMLTDDGRLCCSTDNGATWRDEPLDDDASLLPAAAEAVCISWPYGPADNTDYVLLVGKPRQEDIGTMRVWHKIESHDGSKGQWVLMPFDDDNHYPLPFSNNLTMACYENMVLAVDDNKTVRVSRDQGVSWHVNSVYKLPSTLSGSHFTMATDAQGRLWLLTNSGQLWQGKLR